MVVLASCKLEGVCCFFLALCSPCGKRQIGFKSGLSDCLNKRNKVTHILLDHDTQHFSKWNYSAFRKSNWKIHFSLHFTQIIGLMFAYLITNIFFPISVCLYFVYLSHTTNKVSNSAISSSRHIYSICTFADDHTVDLHVSYKIKNVPFLYLVFF